MNEIEKRQIAYEIFEREIRVIALDELSKRMAARQNGN